MSEDDPLNVPYRERERSITMERWEHELPVAGDALADDLESHEELFTINIGPHHPATHGVLRLLTTLEGETVRRVVPIIGYVHTGIEKSCEDQEYWKVIPFVERMDYLAYYFNAAVYCKAVEELLGIEIPPRAQALRVIHLELNRIASHLFWLGTSILDLGAMSMVFYGIRERDRVLDLFEMSSGQRLHTRFFQVGGCIEDIPPGFEEQTRKFLADFPARIGQYEDILNRNEIFLQRMKGTGIVSREDLHALSVTGPLLRCAGDPWDLRKAAPYWGYEQYDFRIPVGSVGDNFDRYMVRIAEMRESVRIVEQALDGLPAGPYISDNRKVALPPRHELATSMEALIHHFKLVTEGFRVPPGEHYAAIESPRGELGCFVLADGSAKPARVHMRDPSFHNLQALPAMCEGGLVADMIAGVAMLDPILGGRSVSEHAPPPDTEGTGEKGVSQPDRFGQTTPQGDVGTTAAAAWDQAADLSKDPAVVPDPAEVAVPDELRRAIESAMALYPDRRSASIPALHAAQAVHGWCSPTALRQVAAVMQVTPAFLSSVASFYDQLNEEPLGRNKVYVCTSVACVMAKAKRVYEAIAAEGQDLEDTEIREFECLGACDMAPMASVNGRYVGPLDVSDAPEIVAAVREGRAPLPGRGLEDSDYRLPWGGRA